MRKDKPKTNNQICNRKQSSKAWHEWGVRPISVHYGRSPGGRLRKTVKIVDLQKELELISTHVAEQRGKQERLTELRERILESSKNIGTISAPLQRERDKAILILTNFGVDVKKYPELNNFWGVFSPHVS